MREKDIFYSKSGREERPSESERERDSERETHTHTRKQLQRKTCTMRVCVYIYIHIYELRVLLFHLRYASKLFRVVALPLSNYFTNLASRNALVISTFFFLFVCVNMTLSTALPSFFSSRRSPPSPSSPSFSSPFAAF